MCMSIICISNSLNACSFFVTYRDLYILSKINSRFKLKFKNFISIEKVMINVMNAQQQQYLQQQQQYQQYAALMQYMQQPQGDQNRAFPPQNPGYPFPNPSNAFPMLDTTKPLNPVQTSNPPHGALAAGAVGNVSRFTPPPPPPVGILELLLKDGAPEGETRESTDSVVAQILHRWNAKLDVWIEAHPQERPSAPCPPAAQYTTVSAWMEKVTAWYVANFGTRATLISQRRGRGRGGGRGNFSGGGRGNYSSGNGRGNGYQNTNNNRGFSN